MADGAPRGGSFGVSRTWLSTSSARNPARVFRFSPDGRAVYTVEHGRVRTHHLQHNPDSSAAGQLVSIHRQPLTRLTGHVCGGHVLEVRREAGWVAQRGR